MSLFNEYSNGKAHSYRDQDVAEARRIAQEDSKAGQSILAYIEGGRWAPVLEACYDFVINLDRDEMDLWIDRNPDLSRWVSVWGETQEGRNPRRQMFERGQERVEAMDAGEAEAPPFPTPPQSSSVSDITSIDDLLRDMIRRRNSYRNWNPHSFAAIAESRSEIELSRGLAREMSLPLGGPNYSSAELRAGREFPSEFPAEVVARAAMAMVEQDRYIDAPSEYLSMFARLDFDERQSIVRANPGLTQFASAYGRCSGMIHGEQMTNILPVLGPVYRL